MYIDGWAYKENESELQQKNLNVFNDLVQKEAYKHITVEYVSVGYAKTTKAGTVSNGFEISERDLAIYLDSGNLCFGGESTIGNGKFAVTIYTD